VSLAALYRRLLLLLLCRGRGARRQPGFEWLREM